MRDGISGNDALSLEYKLLYGCPTRYADVSDFIGDAVLQRFLSVDERHFSKQVFNIRDRHTGMPNHDFQY